jgi:hypothetical protein
VAVTAGPLVGPLPRGEGVTETIRSIPDRHLVDTDSLRDQGAMVRRNSNNSSRDMDSSNRVTARPVQLLECQVRDQQAIRQIQIRMPSQECRRACIPDNRG